MHHFLIATYSPLSYVSLGQHNVPIRFCLHFYVHVFHTLKMKVRNIAITQKIKTLNLQLELSISSYTKEKLQRHKAKESARNLTNPILKL